MLSKIGKPLLDNPRVNWKAIGVLFLIGEFSISTYVRYRQLRKIKSRKVPASIKHVFTTDEIAKAEGYTSDCLKFDIVKDAVGLVTKVAIISFDILPKVWSLSCAVSSKLGTMGFIGSLFINNSISQSLIFSNFTTLMDSFTEIPTSYFQQFYLEEKWEFNKSTKLLFFKHQFLLTALSCVCSTPFVYSLLKVLQTFGSSSVMYAMLVVLAGLVMLHTIGPSVQGLLFRMKPLREGQLRAKIENLARSHTFPVSEIYEMNGSSVTSHSNAFYSGLPWSKKIVLFDTLIEKFTDNEIIGVLTHEIAHWKMNHVLQMLLVEQLQVASSFTAFSWFVTNNSLRTSFGFQANAPPVVAFCLFTYEAKPLYLINEVLYNLMIRKNEYQADHFAMEQGCKDDLSKALIRLNGNGLKAKDNDWLYSIFYAHHPSLTERLEALRYVSSEEEIYSSLVKDEQVSSQDAV